MCKPCVIQGICVCRDFFVVSFKDRQCSRGLTGGHSVVRHACSHALCVFLTICKYNETVLWAWKAVVQILYGTKRRWLRWWIKNMSKPFNSRAEHSVTMLVFTRRSQNSRSEEFVMFAISYHDRSLWLLISYQLRESSLTIELFQRGLSLPHTQQ